MTRVRIALLLVATVTGFGTPTTAAGHPGEKAVSADTIATTDHSVFVSHPWLSLHHFLYQ